MIPVCPKCDVKLFILRFHAIEVDFCETCRGIWLDAGELEQLLSATGAKPDDVFLKILDQSGGLSQPTKHLCPRCDEPLHELSVAAKLKLDRCPQGHGLWFDADELQQLLALAPESTGATRTIEYLNDIFGKSPRTLTMEEIT